VRKAYTTTEAVRRIRAHKPKSKEDFEKIGVPLENDSFDNGSFREVFLTRFKALKIVVKFAMGKSGVVHSSMEIKKLAKLSKFKLLRPYLPEVYYHNYRTGIIVMRKYPEFKWKREVDYVAKIGALTGKLIQALTSVEMDDIREDNIRSDGKKFVFIDLGY
jgi:hypothetical protein